MGTPLVVVALVLLRASLAEPPCEGKVDDEYRACADRTVSRYLVSLSEEDIGAVVSAGAGTSTFLKSADIGRHMLGLRKQQCR